MTAQLPLFGDTKPTRAHQPVLRRVDLEQAKTIRFADRTFDVIKVNSDRTVTCLDQASTAAKPLPDVIPFEYIEGVGL